MVDEEYLEINLLNQAKEQHPYEFQINEVKSVKVYTTSDILVTFDNNVSIFYNVRTHHSRSVGDMNKRTNKDIEKYFGYLLQLQMTDKFIGQQELANKLGTTQPRVSLFINGQSFPSYFMVKAICDAIGCTIDKLYLPISYSRENHTLL